MSASLKPGGVVDGQKIYDVSHVLAADFGARTINSPLTVAINWDDSYIYFFPNDYGVYVSKDGHLLVGFFQAVEGIIGLIKDSNPTDAINVDSRRLLANDGSTIVLDWSNPSIATFNVPIAGDGTQLTGIVLSGGTGSVIAGTKTATGTATTTFTVTIGVTMANNTYKVATGGDNALSSAVHYVNNKTTTAFDIVYLAGLTGAVSIDWIVTP